GLREELDRCAERRKRGKKGSEAPRGPLLVVGGRCKLSNAAKSIPGVEVVSARKLCVEDLAPGAAPGRLTVWVEPSLDVLEERLRGGGAG
ncbi:MAG: 50S ribosomal protein L4, partial [Candidatus Brockarchaeota archaeon]|nr:50S ribosomal protein L4 [Candidatus Brockarchaeota archaeon]